MYAIRSYYETGKGAVRVYFYPVQRIPHKHLFPGQIWQADQIGFGQGQFSLAQKIKKNFRQRERLDIGLSHRADGGGNAFIQHFFAPYITVFAFQGRAFRACNMKSNRPFFPGKGIHIVGQAVPPAVKSRIGAVPGLKLV